MNFFGSRPALVGPENIKVPNRFIWANQDTLCPEEYQKNFLPDISREDERRFDGSHNDLPSRSDPGARGDKNVNRNHVNRKAAGHTSAHS